MAAPSGPILFNSSTGSDTAASGLGPASAVTGSSAELDGTSTVDVSFDGVTLSGISAGDLLFCDTASGRKFSVIASVDTINETITTDDAWGTESGVSWAVGGKRATFDGTVQIFADWYGGWIVETETDQTVAVDLRANPASGSVNNYVEIRCNNKTITKSYNNYWTAIFPLPDFSILKDAVLTTSITNGGLVIATNGYGTERLIQNVHIDGTLGGGSLAYGAYMSRTGFFMDCSFKNCSTGFTGASVGYCQFSNCVFDSNLTYGANPQHHGGFTNCIFSNNGNHGLLCGNSNRHYLLDNCISYGNGGDGFNMAAAQVDGIAQFKNNIASSNTGYGYNFPTARGNPMLNNVDYNNTAGRVAGYYTDIDPITLTADPFTDAANGDFSLNNDAGGGTVLREATNAIGNTQSKPFLWLTDGTSVTSDPPAESGTQFYPFRHLLEAPAKGDPDFLPHPLRGS